ncbi:MAG TPA: hypothetical protein PKX06_02510 [Phenylobacterium sp.]|nr:hypothetical protein [Phenylobacterium sp.]
MRRFSIIGTAHLADPGMLEALEAALDLATPDQLVLEMPDEAAVTGDVAGQKPEMMAAYSWAKGRGVPVRGHEPQGLSVLRSGLTTEAIGSLVQEMEGLVSSLTVRRIIDVFCQRGELESEAERRLRVVIEALVDPELSLVRTRGIIAAIEQVAAPQGDVLILCGGAHVPLVARALESCRIIHGEYFY